MVPLNTIEPLLWLNVPLFVKSPAIFKDVVDGAVRVLLTMTSLNEQAAVPVMAVLPLKLTIPVPALIVPLLDMFPEILVVPDDSVTVPDTVTLLKLETPDNKVFAPPKVTVPVPGENEPPVALQLLPFMTMLLDPAAKVPAENTTSPLTVTGVEFRFTVPLLATVRFCKAVDEVGNSAPVFPVPVYVTL